MEPIEIIYRHSPGYGWDASSSDLKLRFNEILAAGDFTYEATRARVEDALRWSQENDALAFEHYVHESSIAAYVAEQERASAPAAAKTATKA
jgi:hypothetical protein